MHFFDATHSSINTINAVPEPAKPSQGAFGGQPQSQQGYAASTYQRDAAAGQAAPDKQVHGFACMHGSWKAC